MRFHALNRRCVSVLGVPIPLLINGKQRKTNDRGYSAESFLKGNVEITTTRGNLLQQTRTMAPSHKHAHQGCGAAPRPINYSAGNVPNNNSGSLIRACAPAGGCYLKVMTVFWWSCTTWLAAVMRPSCSGDFLRSQALEVIAAEEDLSFAAAPFEVPHHTLAAQTGRAERPPARRLIPALRFAPQETS